MSTHPRASGLNFPQSQPIQLVRPNLSSIRLRDARSSTHTECPKILPWVEGNALGKFAHRALIGVWYKFQGGHVNSRRWVPSCQEYRIEGSTNVGKYPLIMTTPLRKDYKQGRRGKVVGVGKVWEVKHESSEKKTLLGEKGILLGFQGRISVVQ